jgi:4-nitrophenyl phosphatase
LPIKQFILDMDGVLWRGDTPLPGFNQFFATLAERDIPFLLATNNASKTPQQYIQKLGKLGLAVDEAQIMTSAEATGSFLQHEYPAGTRAYVVGGDGLHYALSRRDFELVKSFDPDLDVPLVVIGFNPAVCYQDLAIATLYVNKGARFIGSNPDSSFPSEMGQLPGAGALLALVSAATEVKPEIIGKPGPTIFREALLRLGAEAGQTAMIGDRLNTDIAGADAAGLVKVMVLSGISRPEEIAASPWQPDYVYQDLADVTANLDTVLAHE